MQQLQMLNICVLRVHEGEESKNWRNNSPQISKLVNTINPQIQEGQWTPSIRNMDKTNQGTS